MSADTFIGVWKFTDWYRVTGVEQAPDNLVYNKEYFDSYEEFKMVVDDYFKRSKLYKTKEEAYKRLKNWDRILWWWWWFLCLNRILNNRIWIWF